MSNSSAPRASARKGEMPARNPSPRSEIAESRPAPEASALRTRVDRVVVLLVLLATWVALSATLGSYWVGSPWGVATRLGADLWSGLWHGLNFLAGPYWAESALGAWTRPTNL